MWFIYVYHEKHDQEDRRVENTVEWLVIQLNIL